MVLLNPQIGPRRWARLLVRPAAAVAAVVVLVSLAAMAAQPPAAPAPAISPAARKAVYPDDPKQMEDAAAKDPLEFLRMALKWCDTRVTDYTCLFTKQEKIAGELRPAEQMRMKFRADAFSVYLKWVGDASTGQEVIYVVGQNDGKAVAHPTGLLGVLFRKVMIDPVSKTALKHSRRPITKAGMANMLRVIVPQCEDAKTRGDLTLTYEGVRAVDGRQTYVFKRTLPNRNKNPCPVLVIYIDREFLACVRTDAYDWDGSLLSIYGYTDLTINPGLTDDDFDPDNREYNFRLF